VSSATFGQLGEGEGEATAVDGEGEGAGSHGRVVPTSATPMTTTVTTATIAPRSRGLADDPEKLIWSAL
jgi:hypothetical protein